jgi:hypothetical protein
VLWALEKFDFGLEYSEAWLKQALAEKDCPKPRWLKDG